MKRRVLTAIAVLALAGAGAPPFLDHTQGLFDSSNQPLVDVQTWVQHVNLFTS